MEEHPEAVCVNCGGKDFCVDGGFYFCTECQTQSQDIRERVFEQNQTIQILERTVKIRNDPNVINKAKLTSWEIYNYILIGLVQEMETLGADNKFKDLIHQLWLQYLTKLEYISDNPNAPPKLNAKFKKRDAEIIYQRRFTKRRKRSKSSVSNYSLSSLDARSRLKAKHKHRKAMEQSEYDQISTILNSSDAQSLANQTLSGLSTDEESIPGHISYSKSAVQKLLKYMTKDHLELHMKDVNSEMTCHKITSKILSKSYAMGPTILSRNKLYCLLYLGCLLSQQKFQISDLIRFCREGRLSFLDYKHFFPETMEEKFIDHSVYSAGQKTIPQYEYFRKLGFELFNYLDLRPCDMSPNLIQLCKRYCTELNLPDQIFNIAGDFINKTRPTFKMRKNASRLPNYEGRVMAFIIYVLKILFNFDDVTEYELSKLAQIYNQTISQDAEETKRKLFNFSDWFSYIEYRNIVLKKTHFPTWFLLEGAEDCPLDLYTKFISQKKNINEIVEPKNLSMKIAKEMLSDLNILQDDSDNLIDFESSFTPFRSYMEQLDKIETFTISGVQLNREIIKNASNHSVEYLIEPQSFLKQINSEKCSIIFANAHPKHKFQRICPYVGEFFQSTIEHWEEKWNRDFDEQKLELLAFDKLMSKILEKHIKNSTEPEKSTKPAVILPPLDQKVFKQKQVLGRDSRGRFCKKDDPKSIDPSKIKPVKKGKWHVSSWNRKPLEIKYNYSLVHQVAMDEINKEEAMKRKLMAKQEKHLNKKKYKYHYIPRMEYCSNIKDFTRLTVEKWKEFELTLPTNFRWLLKECARILEQPTRSLYHEFVCVEVYMNYIHLGRMPVVSKPISNHGAIHKLIKHVNNVW